MLLVKKHFPPILEENTLTYFRYLEGIVESIDNEAVGEATRKLTGINVRISPSEPQYFPLILQDIEKIHNKLGLRMEYYKSMKTSGTVNYDISF